MRVSTDMCMHVGEYVVNVPIHTHTTYVCDLLLFYFSFILYLLASLPILISLSHTREMCYFVLFIYFYIFIKLTQFSLFICKEC